MSKPVACAVCGISTNQAAAPTARAASMAITSAATPDGGTTTVTEPNACRRWEAVACRRNSAEVPVLPVSSCRMPDHP